MRDLWIGMVCVAAAACGPRQTPGGPAPERSETTMTITRSLSLGRAVSAEPTTLDRFQPAVPAFGETPHCDSLEADGERLLLVAFENGPGGAERNVVLRFSTSGALRHYSDVRGDLRGGGDRTSISANLETGEVFATNESSAVSAIARGTWSTAMDLPNLGTPRAVVERIKRQCGGAE